MDLVSVIIPCYNVSPFIDNLSWIFEQTYPELEFVLVDDCSKDDTWQKLQAFKQQHADKRIVIAQNEKNSGAAATRNRGFALSSGQYVCFWDADDKAYPQFVEKMLAKLQQEQADFVYCAHNTLNHKGSGRCYPIPNDLLAIQNDIDALKQQVFQFYSAVWNKMVRRSFIQEHDIKFPLIAICEDNCWTMQLVLNAQKIALINEPYYQYYTGHATSLVHQNKLKEPAFWQLMHFYSDYISKSEFASLLHDEWLMYFWCYVLNNHQIIAPEDAEGTQEKFFLKVREFCQQNNIALTDAALPLAYRTPVYLLLPNIGGLAAKRAKLKQSYLSGQKLLPVMHKLSALIKDAEARLKEDSK